jgi:tyrosyl-tRNA synthetase
MGMGAAELLEELRARGLVHDSTDLAGLGDGPVTVYYGCDPSADSLHVGNLIGVLVLRRFMEAGHRAIALAGGATGMIGDPGGKSEERNLLDAATLATNLAAIQEQLSRLVPGATFVDNAHWTGELRLLEFLRDVGKHVTVNQMIAKESVKARIESEQGISFTEFSYMLLQAHDYLELFRNHGCRLQIGGSDQWGNITAGIDLIRRVEGAHVHGLTWPLIVRADGRKFGKTEEGTVWLAAHRTSPYRFYQYWMNVADADVERFLLQLTLLPVDEARAVAAEHAAAPERRLGQRRLADEVTALVHGPAARAAAVGASQLLFGGSPAAASVAALEAVAAEVDCRPVERGAVEAGVDVVELFTPFLPSASEARRLHRQGALYVNNERAPDTIGAEDLLHGRWLLLRRGKKDYFLVEAAPA